MEIEWGGGILCDSCADELNRNNDYEILSISQMSDMVAENKSEYIIIISVQAENTRNEIIEIIKKMNLYDVDLVSLYGIKWAILFYNRKWGGRLSEAELGINDSGVGVRMARNVMMYMSYFVALPYLEEMILVYQPGKVGSLAVCSGLNKQGIHNLHIHSLRDMEVIKTVMEKRNGKIISAVRNPLEWKISLFWQMLESRYFDCPNADFEMLQTSFWRTDFRKWEYSWFDQELKGIMGIDIFEYPFDREAGYTIIRKDNVELLLMTTEKMGDLEDVIGNFVGVENFKLTQENAGEQKEYCFAYRDYKKEFRIQRSVMEGICADDRLLHFYTEKDINLFREKWSKNIVEDGK